MRSALVIASTGNAWGIPEPVFLVSYGLLCCTLALVATRWYRAGATEIVEAPGLVLTPEMVALMLGGPERAFRTAASSMARKGFIEASDTDIQCNDAPADATPLEQAIASSLHQTLLPFTVRADPQVLSALGALRQQLSEAGYLITVRRRLGLVRLLIFGANLWLLGSVRLVVEFKTDKPISLLLITQVLFTLALWGLYAAGVRQVPPRAQILLDNVKQLEKQALSLKRHESRIIPLSGDTWVLLEQATLDAIHTTSPLYVTNPDLARHLGIIGTAPAISTWTGAGSSSDESAFSARTADHDGSTRAGDDAIGGWDDA